jgi:hypothetical protein
VANYHDWLLFVTFAPGSIRGILDPLIPHANSKSNREQISDYGLVLEQGRMWIEAKAAEILADPRVARLFLGGGLAPEERAPRSGA